MKPKLNRTSRCFLLFLLAALSVLLFQWHAVTATLSNFDTSVDIDGMRRGYEYAQINGTAHWWMGKWINEASNYFRPGASYIHYFQFWILDHYGFQAGSIFSVGVYVLFCAACGVLAWLMSGKWSSALFATVAAAFIPRLTIYDKWLAYFPYMDGISAMLFQVIAFCCFLMFCRKIKSRYLVGAWLAFIVALLCKEATAFTPLLMTVMVMGISSIRLPRKIALAHLGMMLAAGAMILKYGRIATGKSGSLSILHGFGPVSSILMDIGL